MSQLLEVFGSILKQEDILTINDRILPGSLVFEAIAPFPGYYHEAPDTAKPVYMYLALQESYALIDIIRGTQAVEKIFGDRFDAGKGVVQIYHESYHVLRVRHLQRYELIGKLQQEYQKQGLFFLHKTRKDMEEPARIRVIKFFSLEQIDEGIFLDVKEPYHAYLELPKYHPWDELTALTNKVKYNWEGSKFDAAMGAFFHEGKLHEFVRIYSDKLCPEYLRELRKLYLLKIK